MCRYRNCQSNPYLQVLMDTGPQIHTEGYSEFSFSRVCSCTAGCGLCRPHVHGMPCHLLWWVALLASGTHGKVGRSYPVPVQAEQGICPGRDSPRLSSLLWLWSVLASASQPGLHGCRVWDTLLCSMVRILKPRFLFLQSFRKAENVNYKPRVVIVL